MNRSIAIYFGQYYITSFIFRFFSGAEKVNTIGKFYKLSLDFLPVL